MRQERIRAAKYTVDGGARGMREVFRSEEHRWVPNSGWITFQMRSEKDLSHALWLMRLSYLRYALKSHNMGLADLLHPTAHAKGATSKIAS